MKRVVLGANDSLNVVSLVLAIEELGGRYETSESRELGTGLHRFFFPAGDVSVFIDAWQVDLYGPDDLVDSILAAIGGQTPG